MATTIKTALDPEVAHTVTIELSGHHGGFDVTVKAAKPGAFPGEWVDAEAEYVIDADTLARVFEIITTNGKRV